MYGTCTGVKRVTPKFLKMSLAENVKRIFDKKWSRKISSVMK